MSGIKSLKSLLLQMDSIEGTTEGGRRFKITYSQETQCFYTQIFSGKNDVYEPQLRMLDVIKNNILSVINKIDRNFFDKRAYLGKPIMTQRKTIFIEGKHEEKPLNVRIRVENNWVGGNMNFKGNNTQLELNRTVPVHIHTNQKHNWLYLHYQKPEVWLEILEYNIKTQYYTCCRNNILGKFNFCYTCGKKQEVNNLEITGVMGTELLNLLS